MSSVRESMEKQLKSIQDRIKTLKDDPESFIAEVTEGLEKAEETIKERLAGDELKKIEQAQQQAVGDQDE